MQPGNVGMMMTGYVNWLGLDNWLTDSEIIMVTWHELFHNYGCEHLWDIDHWYFIMSMDENLGGLPVQERTLNEVTDNTILNNIGHFDEP